MTGQAPNEIKIACACGKHIRAPGPDVNVKCPKCGKALHVPGHPTAPGPPLPQGMDETTRRMTLGGAGVVGLLILIFASRVTWSTRERRRQLEHRRAQAERTRAQEALIHAASELEAAAHTLLDQRKFAEAKAKYAEALKPLDRLDDKTHPMEAAIAEALASDDIKFGSDARYVHFEGKWLTKQQRDDVLAERFKKQQEAKGMIMFRGRWVDPTERDKMLKCEEQDRLTEEERKRKLREAAEERKRKDREAALDLKRRQRVGALTERWDAAKAERIKSLAAKVAENVFGRTVNWDGSPAVVRSARIQKQAEGRDAGQYLFDME